MGLVERRHDALAGGKNLVAGKPARDWAVEKCSSRSVLETAADSESLELAHVHDQLSAGRSRGVEVERQEDAGDADVVIFEAIAARTLGRVHAQDNPSY